VADDVQGNAGPFDVQTIKQLVRLMSRHDLSAIDLQHGELRIRLRRGGVASPSPYVAPPAAVPVATVPAAPNPAAATTPAENPGRKTIPIKSPTPGTFYLSPNPGAPPFVTKGARVTPTTVVGIIEAMKVFSEIPAECSGVVTAILVENQQPVEYGQVLFEVDPAG
jgi:acetyl-CoA carboxylase biotin carboxyl carrier protein